MSFSFLPDFWLRFLVAVLLLWKQNRIKSQAFDWIWPSSHELGGKKRQSEKQSWGPSERKSDCPSPFCSLYYREKSGNCRTNFLLIAQLCGRDTNPSKNLPGTLFSEPQNSKCVFSFRVIAVWPTYKFLVWLFSAVLWRILMGFSLPPSRSSSTSDNSKLWRWLDFKKQNKIPNQFKSQGVTNQCPL